MKRATSSLPPAVLALGVPVLLATAGAVYWHMQRSPAPQASVQAVVPAKATQGPIQTVALNTHQALPSKAPDGTLRVAPALPSLEEALGLESQLSFARRLQVVHALNAAKLDTAQADALLAFVAEKRQPAGLSVAQLRALKNDILNVLVARPASAQALAATLRTIHDDPEQEPGMRDYALQFLAALSATAGAEPQWRAVQGTDPALAATALLQLLSFSREGKLTAPPPSVHRPSGPPTSGPPPSSVQVSSLSPQVSSSPLQSLRAAALRLASDDTAPEPSRATALQVCGQLNLTEARALADSLARSERVGMPLRIAAIATLGDLGGDAETRTYLTRLTTGPERRLRVPAESALKRFSIN